MSKNYTTIPAQPGVYAVRLVRCRGSSVVDFVKYPVIGWIVPDFEIRLPGYSAVEGATPVLAHKVTVPSGSMDEWAILYPDGTACCMGENPEVISYEAWLEEAEERLTRYQKRRAERRPPVAPVA